MAEAVRRDPRAALRRGARRVAWALACALLASVGAPGCGGEPDTPEARIRATLAEMAQAVEARDAARLRAHVAGDYRDAAGRDRRALGQLVAFYLMRHQSLHVMLRVRDVAIREPGRAQVVAVAAVAGRPIEIADRDRLRADVYRLDLDLEERDGAWLLTWAQWRPTPATDLL